MLFHLFAWILITFTCYGWGEWLFVLVRRKTVAGQVTGYGSLPFFSLGGLAVVGTFAYWFSLAGPLPWLFRGLIFIVPVCRALISSPFRAQFRFHAHLFFVRGNTVGTVLTISCLLTVLLISASPVIHPDTLNYHQFAVRVFRDYGYITGIVNARRDLGFQSSWFAALNVFDPSLITCRISYPLAGVVMAWLILALRTAGTETRLEPAISPAAGYALALLAFTMISWTQIRLTAASASPDFITSIFVITAFWVFTTRADGGISDDFAAAFFSFAAVLTKLSAFPVLLIPLSILISSWRQRHFRVVLQVSITGGLMIFPALWRSYLESGFILYPSTAFDLFHPDWKMPVPQVAALQDYIKAYARYPVSDAESANFLRLPFSAWGQRWWEHLYLVDKLLVGATLIALVTGLLFFRTWRRQVGPRAQLACGVALTGIIFWFLFAPDPRFGSGFLLTFIALASIPLSAGTKIPQPFVRFGEAVFCLAVLLYCGYRIVHFGKNGEWRTPAGVVNEAPGSPDCTDEVKKLLFPDLPYGGPLPDSCRQFFFRGNTVAEGFTPLR